MALLVLLRHAEAENKNAQGDFERRLTPQSKAHAQATSRTLLERGVKPDRLISSPAARALETAQIAAAAFGMQSAAVATDARIYEGGVDGLLDVVRQHAPGSKTFLLAGHNPGISELATFFAGDSMHMAKGSAAVFEIKDWTRLARGCGAPGQVIDGA